MKKVVKFFMIAATLGIFGFTASAGATVGASAAEAKITTPATGYTSAEQVDYQTTNGYVKNWGARGENCTFLSTKAKSFYTSTTSFEALSAKRGGMSTSSAPNSQLYKSLQETMKVKHTKKTNYEETKQLYRYTDCVSNDSTKLSCFYSGAMLDSAWSYGGTIWNREHTWPNSKGLNGDDENDIMMLRPTASSENFGRGNKAYGESSGYYHPNDSVKGDCARIVLYVYTRWANTGKMWGSDGVIESKEILLKWMEEDPVDTWEMGRNDAVQSITGTRNIFIDYPEYAWLLFSEEVPETVTPSGKAMSGVANGESKDEGSSDGEIPVIDTGKKRGCGSSVALSVGSITVALACAYVLKRRSK